MQATAVVINSGAGDLTLGIQMAGYEVAAAYEADKKAIKLQEINFKTPVYPLSAEGIDLKYLSRIDLLAARFYQPVFSPRMRAAQRDGSLEVYHFFETLERYRPRAFLLLLNSAALGQAPFGEFMETVSNRGYRLAWQKLDVGQATGFPVTERKAFVVGTLADTEDGFTFPKISSSKQTSLEEYLTLKQEVDPWYFRTNPDDIPRYAAGKRCCCWKGRAYEETDRINWNNIKVPLIWTDGQFRKITHREVANLKGFPANYILPDGADRQWLYKKLMYSCNVPVIQQIGNMIRRQLKGNPWRSQQSERSKRFEGLFHQYLASLPNKENMQPPLAGNTPIDFAVCYNGQKLYLELKYYKNDSALKANLSSLCQQLSSLNTNGDGLPILVVTNKVPDGLKAKYWDAFHVSIWDVTNLLWLFSGLPDVKKEFIALLDYAVTELEPLPPQPNPFQQAEEAPPEPLDWKSKLDRIEVGNEHFQDYEAICVEILKYVLGDYLTLWDVQEQSNAGLYRFDLCCKIKDGVVHDFFDTVKQHFNTKYIVFEFKNYKGEITQKEIYTTEKYLYEKALRKVAIIASRKGADAHAMQAVKGSFRESGKLILCLSDQNLLEMISMKERGDEPADYLSAMLDDLLIHLEK